MVAIALILAAVFIPTAAIPGITGRMYQQFAVTIAISVLISRLQRAHTLARLVLRSFETKNGVPREEELARQGISAIQQALRAHYQMAL